MLVYIATHFHSIHCNIDQNRWQNFPQPHGPCRIRSPSAGVCPQNLPRLQKYTQLLKKNRTTNKKQHNFATQLTFGKKVAANTRLRNVFSQNRSVLFFCSRHKHRLGFNTLKFINAFDYNFGTTSMKF